MYYPYFRGKQFELLAVRERAELLAARQFVPIVEPVRESLSALARAVDAVRDASGRLVIVVNPQVGYFAGDDAGLREFVELQCAVDEVVTPAVIVDEAVAVETLDRLCVGGSGRPHAVLHRRALTQDEAAELLDSDVRVSHHVFFEGLVSRRYRQRFTGGQRVLIQDGFRAVRNRDYQLVEQEFFSELHLVFEEDGLSGYGDFSIVGDRYSEGGGPAYAVAIHLTYISGEHDGEMWVHHFVSDSVDTPVDPAGKFAEAVARLAAAAEAPDSEIQRTDAVREFLDLHSRGHFPGLGYVKKLSMMHHLETLAAFHAD